MTLQSTDHPGNLETILLVEDQPAIRRIAARLLACSGFAVLEAADGAEAMAEALDPTRTIDLFMVDLFLPDIHGCDLADKLRRVRPDVPVLFMTGASGNAEMNAELVGADRRVLAKPFTHVELESAVRRALDGVAEPR